MKVKLTITIDKDLVPQAKRYAHSRGVSLSHVIEDGLQELVADRPQPFSQRWRGRFRPAARDDARYRALANKYL